MKLDSRMRRARWIAAKAKTHPLYQNNIRKWEGPFLVRWIFWNLLKSNNPWTTNDFDYVYNRSPGTAERFSLFLSMLGYRK